VRENVGKDYPVIIKLDSYLCSFNTLPLFAKLINLKESLDTAKRLEAAGIDAIEVSCFLPSRGALPIKQLMLSELKTHGEFKKSIIANIFLTPLDLITNNNFWFKPHQNINHIKIFKQKLNIPILAGSCFRDPEYMRGIIKKDDADMICLARPLICNPNFPNEILSGSNHKSKCLNCNICVVYPSNDRQLKCFYGKMPIN